MYIFIVGITLYTIFIRSITAIHYLEGNMDYNYNNNNNMMNNQQFYNQPPVYNPPELEQPCGVGDWMLTLFLSCIPVIGFILLLIWAFGGGNKSKANWAKATLIWMVIGIVFSIIFFSVVGTAMFQIARQYR